MLLPSYSSYENLRVGSFNSLSTKYREMKKTVFSPPILANKQNCNKTEVFLSSVLHFEIIIVTNSRI